MITTHRFTKNKNEIKWFEKFELLKQFKEEFGRFPKYKETYKGVNIGGWCHNQRQVYKGYTTGVMNKERIELLESIGFSWGCLQDDHWNIRYDLLKEFKEEFNRFPYQKEIYKGVKIGYWLQNQRVAKKGRKNGYHLSKEKIDLLESIGVIWNVYDQQWYDIFNLLKEFKKEFHRFPIQNEVYKGIKIGKWCNTQRQLKNNGKGKGYTISKERIKMLNSIRFPWKIKKKK